MTPSTSLLNILSCTNSQQLADFCTLAIPSIWGQLKQPLKRTVAFKQFCAKLLKATQISCACIVVALYYIHRLRSAYPYIHASIGSEVRLFTTALVLANKYLDDNTFTNKTWSEVSNIPVLELNIMEMEFLSALQYNIHIPYDQFFKWILQCHPWIVPTLLQPSSTMTSSSMTMKPTCSSSSSSLSSHYLSTPPSLSSSSTPHLKRSFENEDSDDDCYSHSNNNNKRRTTYQPKMPYTPPETYQPIHSIMYHQTYQSSPSHYMIPPTQPIIHSHTYPPSMAMTTHPTLQPIGSHPPMMLPENDCHRPILSWSSSSSALASSHHQQHYSTLLTTRVRHLEID
ncbi:unnamed protein product [Cunninghamella blakesleeana]